MAAGFICGISIARVWKAVDALAFIFWNSALACNRDRT